jgi:hypothetical protein
MLADLTGGIPTLFSLLGNTLANFTDDKQMLGRISTLISTDDYLLLELATATAATTDTAKMATMEYEGSNSFHKFAMATLCDYTNCSSDNGRIVCSGAADDDLVEMIASFKPNERMTVRFRSGGEFPLGESETIELYRSRKYTDKAQRDLVGGYADVIRPSHTPYPGGDPFGVVTMLMRPRVTAS